MYCTYIQYIQTSDDGGSVLQRMFSVQDLYIKVYMFTHTYLHTYLQQVEGFHGNNKRLPDLKFVDMFVAIHSDLFILNPRSTFSWEIYLVRLCLINKSSRTGHFPKIKELNLIYKLI